MYSKNIKIMINDDVLVKHSVERLKNGESPRKWIKNWVDYTRLLIKQIREIRDLDFQGIGLDDLSLIGNEDIKPGMRIILCDYLDMNCGAKESDNATILGIVTRINPRDKYVIELEIEGIGHRHDTQRDPERHMTWGQLVYPNLKNYPTILEVTSKPRSDGGNTYYFFNKSSRDLRDNYVKGNPELSRKMLIGAIINTSLRCAENLREKAQYLHSFRKLFKEMCMVLEDLDKIGYRDNLLNDLYLNFVNIDKINHDTCIKLSNMNLETFKKYGY